MTRLRSLICDLRAPGAISLGLAFGLTIGCAGTTTDGGEDTTEGESGAEGADETMGTEASADGAEMGETGETGGGVDEDLLFELTEPQGGPSGINHVVMGWEGSQFVTGYVPDPAADRATRGKIKMYYDNIEAWEDFVEGTGPCFSTCSSASGITTEPTAGDVVAVGLIKQPAAMGGANAWMRRYTWMGDVQWTVEWTNPMEPDGTDQYTGAAFDPTTGDIVVVGSTELAGLWDAMIARYDATGAEIWRTTHSGPTVASLDLFSDVAVDSAGTAYVAGREEGDSMIGSTGIFVAAFDVDGTMTWSDRIDGFADGFDTGSSVDLSPDHSEIIVGGRVYMGGAEQDDIWVGSYDVSGTQQWTVQITDPEHTGECPLWACDYGSSVAYRSDGTVVVSGGISDNRDDRSAYVAILDGTDGATLWERRVDGTTDGYDRAAGVTVDDADAIIVGGALMNDDGDEDWWFAKWVPTLP